MRRLAVAILAIGCLALLVSTISVQAQLVGGDISFAECGSGTYDEEVCDGGKGRKAWREFCNGATSSAWRAFAPLWRV